MSWECSRNKKLVTTLKFCIHFLYFKGKGGNQKYLSQRFFEWQIALNMKQKMQCVYLLLPSLPIYVVVFFL